MAIVISGRRYEVALKTGVFIPSTDFITNESVRLPRTGFRKRNTSWVRGIVAHTRMGQWPVNVKPGGADRKWDLVVSDRWAHSGRMAGAHLAIDGDGSYACLADCLTEATYHAGQVNEVTVGFEMYQEADGTMYEATLQSAVAIIDALTKLLGIQRQYCTERVICRRFARPMASEINRSLDLAFMKDGGEGKDFIGVYGHRNVTRNRGPGDPGDPLWDKLKAAGYEPYQVDKLQDRDAWKARQHTLGMHADDCDGIPGRLTCEMLDKAGYRNGLWVRRDQDAW